MGTTVEHSEFIVRKYYETFKRFLNIVGYSINYKKRQANAREGVYISLKITRDYKQEGAAGEYVSENYLNAVEYWLNELNYWSVRAGFLPMNSEGKAKFLKFVEDRDRRRYIRDKIKTLEKRGELMSIRDLMLARYRCEQKRKAK